MANKLETELTVNISGFLGNLRKGLQGAASSIGAFVKGAGKVNLNTKPAEESLDRLSRKANDTGGLLGKLGSIGGAVGFAAVGAGVAGLAKAMVSGNAEMESYMTQFEVMTGSAENATHLFGEIKKLGAATPFETADLAAAAQKMLGFNIAQEEIIPNMQMLGDLSGGNAEKLKSLTHVFSQISANGKLTGEDLNQMIDAGFNPLTVMSEKTGKSVAQLRAEMEKGAISATAVKDAMAAAVGPGGKFEGMMAKQAGTLQGMVSTLKDVGGEIVRNLGGPVFDEVKKSVGGLLTLLQSPEIQSAVSALGASLAPLVGGLAGAVSALLPVILQVFGVFADALGPIATSLGAIITPIASVLANAMRSLQPILKLVIDVFARLLKVVGEVLNKAAAPLSKIIDVLASNLEAQLAPVLNLVATIFEALLPILVPLIEVVAALLQALQPLIDLALKPLVAIVNAVSSALRTGMAPVMKVVGDLARQLIGQLEGVVEFVKDVGSAIGDFFDGLVGGILSTEQEAAASLERLRREAEEKRNEETRRNLGTWEKLIADAQKVLAGESADAVKRLVGTLETGLASAQATAAQAQATGNAVLAKTFNQHAATLSALLQQAKNFKPPTPTPKPTGGTPAPKPKDTVAAVLDLSSDVQRIVDDANKQITENTLSSIAFAAEKENTALREKYDDQVGMAERASDAIIAKLDENAKKGSKAAAIDFTIDTGELDASGNRILKRFTDEAELRTYLAAQTARQLAAIEEARRLEQQELDKKHREASLKAAADATQKEIDALRNREAAITAETSAALEQRFQLFRDARARERTLLTTDDEREAFDAATLVEFAARELAIEQRARQERIAAIEDDATRELALRLDVIDQRIEAELAREGLSEEGKTRIRLAGERERLRIAQEHYEKHSGLIVAIADISKTIGGEILAAFRRRKAAETEAEAESAASEIQALREQLVRGEITQEESARRELEIVRKYEGDKRTVYKDTSDFIIATNEVIAGITSSLAATMATRNQETFQRFAEGTAQFSDVLVGAATQFSAIVANAAVTQQNVLEAAAKAAAGIAFDFLQKMVPVWSAQILGLKLSTGAVFGPVGSAAAIAEWVALTALLSGVAAAARGLLGLKEGTAWIDAPPGRRGPDRAGVFHLDHGERVITRRDNLRHWDVYEGLRRGKPDDALAALLRLYPSQTPAVQAPAAAGGAVMPRQLARVITQLLDTQSSLARGQERMHQRLVGIEESSASTARTNRQMVRTEVPQSNVWR